MRGGRQTKPSYCRRTPPPPRPGKKIMTGPDPLQVLCIHFPFPAWLLHIYWSESQQTTLTAEEEKRWERNKRNTPAKCACEALLTVNNLPEGVHVCCHGELWWVWRVLLSGKRTKDFGSQIWKPSLWNHQKTWPDRFGCQPSHAKQPEICDHHAIVWLQKYILGTKVSVNNTSCVKITHTLLVNN